MLNNFSKLIKVEYLLCSQKRYISRKLRKAGKTKLFQVHIPAILPKEEQKIENEWRSQYKTNLRSIMTYFAQVELDKHQRGGQDDLERQIKENELAKNLQENDLENERIAKIREEHTMQDWLNRKQMEINAFLGQKQETLASLEKAELQIIELQNESAKYITKPDQLDELIEKSFSNIVDHNFAATLIGEKIMGDVARKHTF